MIGYDQPRASALQSRLPVPAVLDTKQPEQAVSPSLHPALKDGPLRLGRRQPLMHADTSQHTRSQRAHTQRTRAAASGSEIKPLHTRCSG